MGKVGVIAGGGEIPAMLVEALRAKKLDFAVFPIAGFAAPETAAMGTPLHLGRIGKGIKLLKKSGVTEGVLIGSLKRPNLREMVPDFYTLCLLLRIGAMSLGDDGLLKRLVKFMERKGFKVAGIDKYMPYLLAPLGEYGKYGAGKYKKDVAKGLKTAKALGALDVGQGAVVQQGLVLGVEGIEGTDALIARCAGLRKPGAPPVLVKVKKPRQEGRVDLPTIGEQTVLNAAESGFAGIALEAGACLIVNYERTVALADELGLFIAGVRNEDI